MWRETKILLIDDNLDRCRELSTILNFLGEDQLSSTSRDWRLAVDGLPNGSRGVLCVLLGNVESKGGQLEALKQLAAWDEYLPVLLIGEPTPGEWPEDLRARFLAACSEYPELAGLHDLRTRTSGTHNFAQFHVWVPSDWTVAEAHARMDRIEEELQERFPATEILMHLDPEGHTDRETMLPSRTSTSATSGRCRKICLSY